MRPEQLCGQPVCAQPLPHGTGDGFNAFAQEKLHLSALDAAKCHELNLLSAQAVLRGQLTTLRVPVNVWWARDHFFEAVDLSGFVKRGLTEKALAEKAEAVQAISRGLRGTSYPG